MNAPRRSKLPMLEKLVADGKADSFALYALAMEYRAEQRPADALATFEKLREKDPAYVPQYLMAGQMLLAEGRPNDARTWLETGIERARQKGDGKAEGELRQALAECDDG